MKNDTPELPKVSAYPLSWPLGHARARYREDSKFGTRRGPVASQRTTLAEVLKLLQLELDRLGAKNVVLSTTLELRLDGLPRGGQSMPADPGVALYFTLRGKALVLPCDKWRRVECNLMAVVKHIEATRGLERWGVGTVERAFEGFARLPERGTVTPWWVVLGVPSVTTEQRIEDAYRAQVRFKHPDKGGPDEEWHELNEAYEQGMAVVRGGGV
jgi:hypothetical protein